MSVDLGEMKVKNRYKSTKHNKVLKNVRLPFFPFGKSDINLQVGDD